MKCRYCGGEIDVNSKTCPFCGSSISLEDKKELEQLNKKGCPKCGSTNISFVREATGVSRNKKGNSTVLYQTKGICNDCGHTWTTNTSKKSKVWLWVLGWIFLFPLPLTILLLRKKNMKPALKYGIIAGAWVVYLLFGLIYNSGKTDTSSGGTAQATGNITKIEFNSFTKEITLDLSNNYSSSDTNWVNCTVKDKNAFTYEDLVFVSENTDVVTFEYDSMAMSYIYYKATGVSAGETYVYVMTKDGTVSSEKIKVTVTGARPTPTPTSTPIPTSTPKPTETPTPTIDPNATPTPIPERMVWISSSGSKYHSDSSCSNMKNPKQVTESEAKKMGKKPCGKCGG